MELKKKLKDNKIVIGTIVILGFAIGFTAWSFFSSSEKEVKKIEKKELTSEQVKNIDVNFEILEGEQLKELKQIGVIPEYLHPVGRTNPFVKP